MEKVDSKMIILWLLLAKLYRIPIPGHLLVTLIQFASQHDNIWLKELGMCRVNVFDNITPQDTSRTVRLLRRTQTIKS